MAELNEMEWELDGLLMGHGTTYKVVTHSGLEDSPTYEASAMDRTGDGQAGQRTFLRDRAVSLTLELASPSNSQRDALRQAVHAPADRTTGKVLRWRHPGEVTKRVTVQPTGEPLSMPGDATNLMHNMPTAKVNLVATDPVIYADAEVTTSFTVASAVTHGQTVTNAGTLTALSPGSMWWQLTAAAGGCTNPFLRLSAFTDETWRYVGTLAEADVVTVGYDRVTRKALVIQSANVRGPDSSPVPVWPALRPGAQTVQMGCSTGGFTATLKHRSTW